MTEVRVGRLIAACLHQAIADVLPDRLEFYEHWLTSEGMRDGSIGAAPMLAVVGFLRTEGPAYDDVMRRGGVYAARWTLASMAPLRRRWITLLPRPWRARASLRIVARTVHSINRTSRATTRVKGTHARIEVVSSMFCEVRNVRSVPLCGFYLALALEVLRQCGLGADGVLERCHAVDGSSCVVSLDLAPVAATSATAEAA